MTEQITNAPNSPEPDNTGGDAPAGDMTSDPMFKLYMIVAAALAVFTASSFVANWAARAEHITTTMSFIIILAVAVCKAVLVGMYFMHLKFDWSKLYFMIIPAFILGVMMMIVLLPDIVVAWH